MTNLQWNKLPQSVNLLKRGGALFGRIPFEQFLLPAHSSTSIPFTTQADPSLFFIPHRRTLYIIVTYPAPYCDFSLKNTEHYCGRPWMKCFAWTSFLHHRGAAKPGALKFRCTYMDHITLYHPVVMLASCFYHVSPCIAIVSPCITLVWCLQHLYHHFIITIVSLWLICAGQPSLEQ